MILTDGNEKLYWVKFECHKVDLFLPLSNRTVPDSPAITCRIYEGFHPRNTSEGERKLLGMGTTVKGPKEKKDRSDKATRTAFGRAINSFVDKEDYALRVHLWDHFLKGGLSKAEVAHWPVESYNSLTQSAS